CRTPERGCGPHRTTGRRTRPMIAGEVRITPHYFHSSWPQSLAFDWVCASRTIIVLSVRGGEGACGPVGYLVQCWQLVRGHRHGRHRWHSCPSDRGTCEMRRSGLPHYCPHNMYCKDKKPNPRQPILDALTDSICLLCVWRSRSGRPIDRSIGGRGDQTVLCPKVDSVR